MQYHFLLSVFRDIIHIIMQSNKREEKEEFSKGVLDLFLKYFPVETPEIFVSRF